MQNREEEEEEEKEKGQEDEEQDDDDDDDDDDVQRQENLLWCLVSAKPVCAYKKIRCCRLLEENATNPVL